MEHARLNKQRFTDVTGFQKFLFWLLQLCIWFKLGLRVWVRFFKLYYKMSACTERASSLFPKIYAYWLNFVNDFAEGLILFRPSTQFPWFHSWLLTAKFILSSIAIHRCTVSKLCNILTVSVYTLHTYSTLKLLTTYEVV